MSETTEDERALDRAVMAELLGAVRSQIAQEQEWALTRPEGPGGPLAQMEEAYRAQLASLAQQVDGIGCTLKTDPGISEAAVHEALRQCVASAQELMQLAIGATALIATMPRTDEG